MITGLSLPRFRNRQDNLNCIRWRMTASRRWMSSTAVLPDRMRASRSSRNTVSAFWSVTKSPATPFLLLSAMGIAVFPGAYGEADLQVGALVAGMLTPVSETPQSCDSKCL